jgi:hypothetical protein
MFICMRTTLNLDDELMRAVKQHAAEVGSTMTEIFEEALREHLRRASVPAQPFDFHWVTVKGRALPGVDIADRDALHRQMEETTGAKRRVSEGMPGQTGKTSRPPTKDKRR